MTAAFIVHIDVPSTLPDELLIVSEDIVEILTRGGMLVEAAAPWAREAGGSLPMSDSLMPPPMSPNTTPTLPGLF